ncbi:hypothetical protein BDN67DRAFT_911511, partial [Paxillus ammoniavirescens]
RCVNSWNTFLKEKLHDANNDHKPGNHFKLPQFVAQHKDELLREYQKLTPAQQPALNVKVHTAREAKVPTTWANPKAINHLVSTAFLTMDHDWTALCLKTGMEGFFMAVHGSIEDYTELKLFFTEKAKKFQPLNKLISNCHTAIQDGLDDILLEKNIKTNIKMNYTNYECQIMERFSIALKGWPL